MPSSRVTIGNHPTTDKTTPLLTDSLTAMLEKEQQPHYALGRSCSNVYHDNSSYPACAATTCITTDDRMKMVDWAYCIVDRLQIDRTSVAMAMTMVDSLLSKTTYQVNPTLQMFQNDCRQYQLLVMTALYTCIKIT